MLSNFLTVRHHLAFFKTKLTSLLLEMAEKHDAKALVQLARNLILRLQKAVEK